MSLGRAIESGLFVGIGFQGLVLAVNLPITSIQPVMQYYAPVMTFWKSDSPLSVPQIISSRKLQKKPSGGTTNVNLPRHKQAQRTRKILDSQAQQQKTHGYGFPNHARAQR